MYPNCFLVRSSAKRGSPMSERRIVIKAALRAVVFSICVKRTEKRECMGVGVSVSVGIFVIYR